MTEYVIGGAWDTGGDVAEDVLFAAVVAYTVWLGVTRFGDRRVYRPLAVRFLAVLLFGLPGIAYDLFLADRGALRLFPVWYCVLSVVVTIMEAPLRPPARVLLTNDNGIDDPKLVALARALAERSETWVVAPAGDRSGTGNSLSVIRTGSLGAERRDLGPGIRAFAVDGFPADCVVLALLGLMRDEPPTLLISGINGGANAGADWMFSGTVGAARVAALAGIPAIAVSGLDDDLPGAVDAAVDWMVRLASGEAVRRLEPGDYLTVSLPRVGPDSIRGVRFADRAPLRFAPRLEAASPTIWRVVGMRDLGAPPPGADAALLEDGYIVVVRMRADEVDRDRLARWRRSGATLPEWRAVAPAGR